MKETIKNKIEELLSKEYHCRPEEFNQKETIFSIKPQTEKPYLKILAYKNCIVVCTSKNLHTEVQDLLKNKSRDEIFECPYVYGQTIHYVPGFDNIPSLSVPLEYQYELLFQEDILSYHGLTGFENSLAFDENGFTSTKAVCIAKHHQKIIGIAGASESAVSNVWEIGVDVTEAYRNAGLGTALVSRLTEELCMRHIVPFYSASVTNLGSQMVASRCGYLPSWVDTFGTMLDGSSVYNYDRLLKTYQKIKKI